MFTVLQDVTLLKALEKGQQKRCIMLVGILNSSSTVDGSTQFRASNPGNLVYHQGVSQGMHRSLPRSSTAS